MAMLTAPAFVFALGDTLRMPVTYRALPAQDGTPGGPIDLTGKICRGRLFNPGLATSGLPPLLLTTDNGGLVVTMATGLMSFVVDDATSRTLAADRRGILLAEGYGYQPSFRPALVYPTRLQVQVRDPSIEPAPGDLATIALFALRLYDPATVDLGTLPIGQAATIVASGPGS